MRAIRQHELGGPDVLRLEDVPDPHPGPGQVRVVVRAAGVHVVDTDVRAGTWFAPTELPMTPGREVAGVVDELGPDVDEAWRGARVVVHLGAASGGYAELAVADVTSLHRLADHVADADAVALMGTGRMAVGVLALARVEPDDVVLVTSAAGGIGTIAVQAAKRAGAVVVGAAGGAAKVEQVRANGADVAVDGVVDGWTDDVVTALGDRVPSLVLDAVGGVQGRAAFDLLGPGGRIVLYGWARGGAITQFTSADLLRSSLSAVVALGAPVLRLPGGLRALEERAQAALAAGELVPALTTFPLADAAAAHAALESRATSGKVVLVP